MLDNWQRIEQVIKWVGAASVSAFAREVGLNRSENLYQIRRGNNGISKDLAEMITTKYPAISKGWLLAGEGDMLAGKAAKEKYDIPFYKSDAVEFVSGLVEEVCASDSESEESGQWPEPAYYISFPMMKGCEFASFTFSDAMQPEITTGSTLFFQSISPEEVIPGGIYLVVSDRFSGIRFVRKGKKADSLRLIAANGEAYDEIEIDRARIKVMFRVKGMLASK